MMLQLNIRADMLHYSNRCEGIDATNGHKFKDKRQKHEPKQAGCDTHTHTHFPEKCKNHSIRLSSPTPPSLS